MAGLLNAIMESGTVVPLLESVDLSTILSESEISIDLEEAILTESAEIDYTLSERMLQGMKDETLLSESFVSGAKEKIKTMMSKIWSVIKSIWGKLRSHLDNLTASNEKFVQKYRKILKDLDQKDFKYEGFEWDFSKVDVAKIWDDVKIIADASMDKATTEASFKSLDVKKIKDVMSGKVLSGAKYNLLEVKLTKAIRGGKDDKITITKIDVDKYCDRISSMKAEKQICKEAQNVASMGYADSMSAIEDASKDSGSGDQKANVALTTKKLALAKDLYGTGASLVNLSSRVIIKAVKASTSEYRSALMQLYRSAGYASTHSESMTIDEIFSTKHY